MTPRRIPESAGTESPARRLREAAFAACCFALIALAVSNGYSAVLQEKSQTKDTQPQAANPAPPDAGDETVLPGDWGPELLYGMLASPNSDAADALLRAAFAAGPAVVPQLEAALKDDRTAEFAAQSLAFIGGKRALEDLAKLEEDKRDLNLRRFFYGALAEFSTDQAASVLYDVVARSDSEPDRSVTEAAIWALTVRNDPAVAARLRELRAKVKDPVIRDDLENAAMIIELGAKGSRGAETGGSIGKAVRGYFAAALDSANAPPSTPSPRAAGRRPPGSKPPAAREAQTSNAAKVEIQNLTFSPDKSRALARVVFEDVMARANYDIVLQKKFGDWAVASVWLGEESEKAAPAGSVEPPH